MLQCHSTHRPSQTIEFVTVDGHSTLRRSLASELASVFPYWTEWIKRHMTNVAQRANAFAQMCLSEMQIFFASQPNDGSNSRFLVPSGHCAPTWA